jgi:hypothetical protein
MAQVQWLYWHAVGSMPSVDGNFPRRAGKSGGNDNILLMTRHQRSQWRIFEIFCSLEPYDGVVVAENRNRCHRGARRER